LRADEQALMQRQAVLEEQLAKEGADVDKLETGSVSGAFSKLFGTYEKRLDKERAEWLAAKLKLDEAVRALEETRRRIAEAEAERASLEGSEENYKELYARRTKLLTESGGEAAQRITAAIEQIERSRANLREIGEALSAGGYAADCLHAAYDHLSKAEDWGTYDMFGGGLIASSIKYNHVDDAADAARQAQLAMDRFNSELADIRIAPLGSVEMSDGLRFADVFFDGLIVDWMAQRGIEQSLDSVARTSAEVDQALMRLRNMDSSEKERLQKLENELHELVMEG
jgi:ATP-dependent Clp protease ATP-binding subunit ClpA